MADDIRLYMFECGTLKCHVENIKMNQGLGEPFEIPVPWYLITHPKGNVVIDGGNAAECAADPRRALGRRRRRLLPDDDARAGVRARAARPPASTRPSVRFILQSHLHLDHTGALAALDEFPNAKVVATRRGVRVRARPRLVRGGRLHPGGLRQAGRRLGTCSRPPTTATTSTATASIRMWQTPGHAPGHQSFEITLPNSGLDAADRRRGLHDGPLGGEGAARLPRLDVVDTVRSVRKLHRIAARSDSTVVTGHDPDAWAGFKHAPEFYD